MNPDRYRQRHRTRQDFRELVDLVAHTACIACFVVVVLTSTVLAVIAALHGSSPIALLPGSIGGAGGWLLSRVRLRRDP